MNLALGERTKMLFSKQNLFYGSGLLANAYKRLFYLLLSEIIIKSSQIIPTMNSFLGSNPSCDQGDNQEEEGGGNDDNADHDLFVFPPHFPSHCLGSVSHIVRLVCDGLWLLDQDLNFLPSLDDFVHVFEGLLFEFGEFFAEGRELVDFGRVVVIIHGGGEEGDEVFEGMGDCSVAFGGFVLFEELLLDFFEEGDCDSGFILNRERTTVESTMTKNTKPSLV